MSDEKESKPDFKAAGAFRLSSRHLGHLDESKEDRSQAVLSAPALAAAPGPPAPKDDCDEDETKPQQWRFQTTYSGSASVGAEELAASVSPLNSMYDLNKFPPYSHIGQDRSPAHALVQSSNK